MKCKLQIPQCIYVFQHGEKERYLSIGILHRFDQTIVSPIDLECGEIVPYFNDMVFTPVVLDSENLKEDNNLKIWLEPLALTDNGILGSC